MVVDEQASLSEPRRVLSSAMYARLTRSLQLIQSVVVNRCQLSDSSDVTTLLERMITSLDKLPLSTQRLDSNLEGDAPADHMTSLDDVMSNCSKASLDPHEGSVSTAATVARKRKKSPSPDCMSDYSKRHKSRSSSPSSLRKLSMTSTLERRSSEKNACESAASASRDDSWSQSTHTGRLASHAGRRHVYTERSQIDSVDIYRSSTSDHNRHDVYRQPRDTRRHSDERQPRDTRLHSNERQLRDTRRRGIEPEDTRRSGTDVLRSNDKHNNRTPPRHRGEREERYRVAHAYTHSTHRSGYDSSTYHRYSTSSFYQSSHYVHKQW